MTSANLNWRQPRRTAHSAKAFRHLRDDPSGGRSEFLLIDFVQHVCEPFRRTPLASRARGHSRPQVIGDAKARRHGSAVEISIFPSAHATEASKLRVQGG